jgi:2-oxoglutarate dehydrogenase E2 component (dihydrolipoamide succinyltransferase)
MRRTIAENMLISMATAPHVTAVFEADLSAITSHRGSHKQEYEKANVNVTLTAYFVAGAVAAMRVVPEINSRWYDDRLEIFEDINIGIATALGHKGLIVPVIHEAQKLSLREIAVKLADLTARARSNSLTTADVRGGTFTISNHGVSGSLFAAPIIIPQPQSAILGIGKLEKRVVVREVESVDTIQIRPLAYVSLTIDHRVVDAHQTNAWLSKFVETLENWPPD